MSAMFTHDFVINQGEDFRKTLTWKIDGIPVDLTDYTARLKAKSAFASDTAILNLTTENGGITLGGEEGTILLEIPHTATAALGFSGKILYDLELVSAAGVKRLLQGTFTLDLEVTK